MKTFRYVRDPVCLVACACYAANRWGLPLALKGPFLRFYFNDLFLIPGALPFVLWLQRRLGLRDADTPPTGCEVAMHLAIWSLTAELIAPLVFGRATGDGWDVVAYTAGAVLAFGFWSLE